MRVTLAYAVLGHPPDTTLELDEQLGRRLIRDGRARAATDETPLAPDPPPRADLAVWSAEEIRSLRRMTIVQLQAFAAEHFIDLGSAVRRKEILAALEASSIPAG